MKPNKSETNANSLSPKKELCADTFREICIEAKEIIDKEGGIEAALANLKKQKAEQSKKTKDSSSSSEETDSDDGEKPQK